VGQRLLKLPHEFFPLSHLRAGAVSSRFGVEIEVVGGFKDQDQPVAREINLLAHDTVGPNAFEHFGPDVFLPVIALVFLNQVRIVVQIQCKVISLHKQRTEIRKR